MSSIWLVEMYMYIKTDKETAKSVMTIRINNDICDQHGESLLSLQ